MCHEHFTMDFGQVGGALLHCCTAALMHCRVLTLHHRACLAAGTLWCTAAALPGAAVASPCMPCGRRCITVHALRLAGMVHGFHVRS